MYYWFVYCKWLPKETEMISQSRRGTDDLLYVSQHILKEITLTWNNCNIAKIRKNVHKRKMFIRTGIRKKRNTDDSLGSGTKLLLPSSLLGFWHEERETQLLLCWLFHLTQQRAAHPLDPTRSKSQLTAFFSKYPRIPAYSFLGMTSFTSPVTFPIRGFYYDICDCHIVPARARTPALNVCSYPCIKPKSSKPN